MLLRKAAGYSLVTSADGHVMQERDTLQCVHCHLHWYVKPGSGNQRGWCSRCLGPTCGKLTCQPCIPYERLLEQEFQEITRQLERLRMLKGIGL